MAYKVLIAGASRGLGRFLAQRYLENGDVVFAGVRNADAPHIAELKAKFGERLVAVKMDVADTASVNDAVKVVSAHTDSLDMLIFNAGIHCDSSFKPLQDADLDECLEVYNINAVGSLRVIKGFDAFLKDGAKVINISSDSGSVGLNPRTKEFDYCMSKAALNMASKMMQNYFDDVGRSVRVLVVQPGWMRTDMGSMAADLDPYETACKLVDLFAAYDGDALFTDNDGVELPW